MPPGSSEVERRKEMEGQRQNNPSSDDEEQPWFKGSRPGRPRGTEPSRKDCKKIVAQAVPDPGATSRGGGGRAREGEEERAQEHEDDTDRNIRIRLTGKQPCPYPEDSKKRIKTDSKKNDTVGKTEDG